jgi:DNA repair exonuclease SbcCD ATPase subunit
MATRMPFFPTLLFLGLAAALLGAPPGGIAAEVASAPRPRRQLEKKVYTNDDLETPAPTRAEPAAPVAPQAEALAAAVEAPVTAPAVAAFEKLTPYMKESDPAWYRGQLELLRSELARIDALVLRLRAFRATGQGMMGGLILNQPNLRLTPENEIEQLGLRRREILRQVDDLEDLGRRYGILPGVLSGAAPAEIAVSPARPALNPDERGELEKQRTDFEAQLDREKHHFELTQTDLDLAERDQLLFRQQFYSNPGYMADSQGKARLAQLGSEAAARQEEIETAQQKIAALQQDLETLDRALGPRLVELAPEEERAAWQRRVRPLQDDLARVEAELARMRAEAAARGMSLYAEASTGSPTAMLLRRLEQRAAALREHIASFDEEARRTGTPPGGLR